jgi:antitoxin VapB
MTEQKAKVFWSGRSQAVRIPKEFRFDTDEVTIRREGNTLVLRPAKEPVNKDWAWLKNLSGKVDADFEAAALEEMEWGPPDPDVEDFFK